MGVDALGKTLRRAVFLDRDGVLNCAVIRDGRPYPPSSLAELEIPAGVPEILRELKRAGFLLLGVTNQPDVARGTQRQCVVEAINAVLLEALPLQEILVCFHDDHDRCQCRKPLPGLLLQAAARYTIDLASSFMVGDRWRDVEAGRRAGCTTVLIDQGYLDVGSSLPDHRVRSLPEGGAWILSRTKSAEGMP